MGNRKTMGGTPKLEVSAGNRNTLRTQSASLGRIDQYELLRELGGGSTPVASDCGNDSVAEAFQGSLQ